MFDIFLCFVKSVGLPPSTDSKKRLLTAIVPPLFIIFLQIERIFILGKFA